MPSGSNITRWSHQTNVERYVRLLRTPLTDIERQFVRRRLAEERLACREVSALSSGIDLEVNGLAHPPTTGR